MTRCSSRESRRNLAERSAVLFDQAGEAADKHDVGAEDDGELSCRRHAKPVDTARPRKGQRQIERDSGHDEQRTQSQ